MPHHKSQQLYSYTDSGAFAKSTEFAVGLERVSEVVQGKKQLLKHRLFQDEHIANVRALRPLAEDIRDKYKHLVIIGMGGAILNPRLLSGFGRSGEKARITYCDHIDSRAITHLELTLDPEHTAFIVISKSGETVESIALMSTWYAYMQKMFITDLADRFYIITQNKHSTLGRIAEQIGARVMEHEDISGRYASFTNITVLPGLIAGLDMELFCRAGLATLNTLLEHPEGSFIVRGAATMLYMMETERSQFVTMPYKQALADFTEWQAQVLAESLGKNGMGLTPIKSIGPLDQHSQLQLYLDGPRDKFFSIIQAADHSAHTTLPMKLGPLAGHTLAELCDAEHKALLLTLEEHKLPYRAITIAHENEEGLGALVMHSMLEVALCGLALGIDPFNQPAVERIKLHIREGLRVIS